MPQTRPPIALIVTAQEWISLSVETLFSPRGYAVLRTFNGTQALQRIGEFQPDLLVMDKDLRDMRSVDVCRRIREHGHEWSTVPVMLMSNSPWSRDERLEALRAGAWDCCTLPTDGEELFLRVDAWVRAKLAADAVREQGLLDVLTGLYNAQGLLRRIGEVAAMVSRRRAPLACVVIASDAEDIDDRSASSLAARLRALGRASDTLGRLSDNEFVVVAPDTDQTGALRLAERFQAAIQNAQQQEEAPPLRLRFGCYGVPDFRGASIAPSEMLVRAAAALRGATSDQGTIRYFNPVPPTSN